jgi:uncharacterized protein YlaI
MGTYQRLRRSLKVSNAPTGEQLMKTKNLDNIPLGTCVCSSCGIRKSNIEYSFYGTRFTKDGYRLRSNTICDSCSSLKSKELTAIKKTLKNHPRPAYGEPCAICTKPVYKNKMEWG